MISLSLQKNKLEKINIHDLLLSHGLVHLTNDKDLEINDFKKITSKLGKLLNGKLHFLDDEQTVQEVSGNALFGKDEVEWHNDYSFGPGNYWGTILYNKKNGHLSDTDFVDMQKAYNSYQDKSYLHDVEGTYYPPFKFHDICVTEKQLKLLNRVKVSRKFAHRHHITGDYVIYCSPGTLQEKIDITEIVKHCEKNIYNHKWKPNDILIWDNIRMMHRRHSFEGSRILWRSQFWI